MGEHIELDKLRDLEAMAEIMEEVEVVVLVVTMDLLAEKVGTERRAGQGSHHGDKAIFAEC